MLNSVHVTAAAAIAGVVPDPVLAWPLAFGSHIALDTVPHWNWHPAGNKFLIVASCADVALSFGLSYYFATISGHFWVTLIACLLSTVPDLIQGPYYFFKWRPGWLKAFIKWESTRQRWSWMTPWMGLATQVVTVAISLYFIYR